MIKKYKQEIILSAVYLFFVISFYFLYGLILPFFIGLFGAFTVKPLIDRIAKKIKSKNAATAIFLVGSVLIVASIFILFTSFINRDFQRLSKSYNVLKIENQDRLDDAGQKAIEYINSIYDLEKNKGELKQRTDSVMQDFKNLDVASLDTESIKSAFTELSYYFGSNDHNKSQNSRFGFFFILFSSIAYFVLILFQLDYFTSIRQRYITPSMNNKNWLSSLMEDFNTSFGRYFKLRTKIVLILSILYFVTFLIMDMPGSILFTIIILMLSYVAYLQYLVLIPLSISCLVLSTETDYSFLFLFGIVVGVFVLASIIEELLLTPRIMEKNIGMNPVIMILALSIWGYILGTPGLLIGVPITSLMIIYFKRYYPLFTQSIRE